MDDTSKYVNTTVKEVDFFADTNLDQLLGYFDDTLYETGILVDQIVDETLIGINFTDIKGIADFVLNISDKFVNEDKNKSILLLEDLSSDVDNISNNLANISTSLGEIGAEQICKDTFGCTDTISSATATIDKILQEVTSYDAINTAISQIKGVDLNLVQINELVDVVNSAEKTLRDFSSAFVNNYTQGIRDDVMEISNDIKEQITSLTDELKKIDLGNATKDIEVKFIDPISEYTDYVLYATLVPAIVLGIALLLSCCGLIIGNSLI